ncbi:hypothetical protein NIES4106_62180 (plasmid) [Fischerella sp. NIES-4106]|nr:hypothetical protein NIES4106_62180 [Fischerella sp. NIES-4106]
MAVLTKAKISQLEKKVRARSHSSALKTVPTQWEDFVRLTKIRSGNRMVKFTPFDYQSLLVQLMQQHSVVLVVKSRQLGITQCALSFYLKKAIENQAYQAMAFMKNQEDSSNLARRTRTMLESIPEYAKAENDNLGYIKILHGGAIYLKNSSKEGGRSYDSVEDFLYDEAAFSPNIESIYGASSASSAMLGDEGCKLIVSTPSAKVGWYWDRLAENNPEGIDPEIICQQVAAGELPPFYYWVDGNGSCKVVIHWKAHPIYSQRKDYLEYRQKKDGTSWEVVKREYDLCFINPDVSVFDAGLVRECATGDWEDSPERGSEYYMGVDASNLGGDYCTAPVLKKCFDDDGNEYYSKVAMYRKRKMSSEYDIYQISELIRKFKPKKIGIEHTGGTGAVYAEQLQKLHPQVEFVKIHTTQESKLAMIERMIVAMEMKKLRYPNNSPIIEEMLVFKRSGKQLGAIAGKHDDTIMGLAFALLVSPFSVLQVNSIWEI